MRKTLTFLVLYFLGSNLCAQSLGPREQIDSMFESIHTSTNDWLISLSIEQAGTLYDSLGNNSTQTPEGTFLFFKVGRNHFLQKLQFEYIDNSLGVKVMFGKRLSLFTDLNFDYSVDSILLACKESIYPFVYKHDSDDVYNILQPSDHEPYYTMHFKTAQEDGCDIPFTKTSLTESKSFIPYKNLNFLYNSKTFVYRAYLKLMGLVKINTRAF